MTKETLELRTFQSENEMSEAHQKDLKEFPIAWMFGQKTDEEIKECLKPIGAESLHECVSVYGGGVIKKSDSEKFLGMLDRHNKERSLFMKNDRKLADLVYKTMCDVEYFYTGDKEEVLRYLGKSPEDLWTDIRLKKAWEKAEARHKRLARKTWIG